jgi:dihydrofolate synthase/folylpolyglutamate synthase
MIAAILKRHGLRTGSYVSPHLVSYTERVQIAGQDVETHAFAAAVARAAWAADRVNRTLAEDDHVTQFELLTAAAFWELARREVQVVVVEAGLGGRFDATNVIESKVAALTNVGLEHTRWLGPTIGDIAAEKLAVLVEGSVLAVGVDMPAEVLDLARAAVAERGAKLLVAERPTTDFAMGARGSFQRENFALARLAAGAYLQSVGIEMCDSEVRVAAALTSVPGRLHVVADDPFTVVDGAHNPAAVEAMAASLPELLTDRPAALVLGVLDDKDAAGMLARLLPSFERAWFTAPPSPRALSPATLSSLASQLGFEHTECEPHPTRALAAAQSWARSVERGGAVLVTGSVYLVGDLLAHAQELGLRAGLGAEGQAEGERQARKNQEGGGAA